MNWLNRNKVLMLIVMFFAGLSIACTPTTTPGGGTEPPEPASDEVTMYVGSETVDCVGLVPQQCLLVKYAPDADWEYHYDGIEGFAYEPGFEYELRVRRVEVADPPADGSSILYQLIEVVDKTVVAAPSPEEMELADTSWLLTHIEQNGATRTSPANRQVTLEFLANGDIGGNGGCNNYFATYTTSGTNGMQIGPIGMTEMACLEQEHMAQEAEFVAALSTVQSYTLVDGALELAFADGVLRFEPLLPTPPLPLTETTWQLTTFGSGDTAYTPFAGTEITAVFDGARVSGSAGCNSYFGGYTLNGEQISIGELGSTLMACKGETMTQEMEFLQALSNAESIEIEGNQLRLYHAGGTLIFTAVEETAVPPEPDTIPWEQALAILNSGGVTEIFQTHSLEVTLVLANGLTFHTIEPGIDDIFTAVSECGEPCQDIMLATE